MTCDALFAKELVIKGHNQKVYRGFDVRYIQVIKWFITDELDCESLVNEP